MLTCNFQYEQYMIVVAFPGMICRTEIELQCISTRQVWFCFSLSSAHTDRWVSFSDFIDDDTLVLARIAELSFILTNRWRANVEDADSKFLTNWCFQNPWLRFCSTDSLRSRWTDNVNWIGRSCYYTWTFFVYNWKKWHRILSIQVLTGIGFHVLFKLTITRT